MKNSPFALKHKMKKLSPAPLKMNDSLQQILDISPEHHNNSVFLNSNLQGLLSQK